MVPISYKFKSDLNSSTSNMADSDPELDSDFEVDPNIFDQSKRDDKVNPFEDSSDNIGEVTFGREE